MALRRHSDALEIPWRRRTRGGSEREIDGRKQMREANRCGRDFFFFLFCCHRLMHSVCVRGEGERVSHHAFVAAINQQVGHRPIEHRAHNAGQLRCLRLFLFLFLFFFCPVVGASTIAGSTLYLSLALDHSEATN